MFLSVFETGVRRLEFDLFQLLYSPQLFTDGLIFKDEDVNEFELELVVDVSMTHYFRKSSRFFQIFVAPSLLLLCGWLQAC